MLKYLKYLNYLIRHKWFVLLATIKIKGSIYRALIHDLSKFLPSELIPYTRYFYGEHNNIYEGWQGDSEPVKNLYFTVIESDFNLAWCTHIHRNKHHWQYWILHEDSGNTLHLPMPEKYILEMVADWAGAGRAKNGKWDIKKWYRDNYLNIRLNEETRVRIEQILEDLK